jgi:Uma2 family endonuclease
MSSPELNSNKTYTYADYAQWDDGHRWEVIDGAPYCMAPGLSVRHQRILVDFTRQISTFLMDKDCEVIIAPCDLLLPEAGEKAEQTKNIFQPDIMVVCDPSKIKDKYVVGTPDWVIEILSPSTAKKDKIQKKKAYEKAGVKEYWLVSQTYGTITIFRLKDGKLIHQDVYDETAELDVETLPGLTIIAKDILPAIKRVKEEQETYQA